MQIDAEKVKEQKAQYEAEVKKLETAIQRLSGAILALDALLKQLEPEAKPEG